MKISIVFLSLLLSSTLFGQENPFVGKWVVYDIQPFAKKTEIPSTLKEGMEAYIFFKEDFTFVKNVNGVIVQGQYEFTGNKLIFKEPNDKGEYVKSWLIRWPKNTKDPLPLTPEIDIMYPELYSILDKNVEIDFYYIKSEEE